MCTLVLNKERGFGQNKEVFHIQTYMVFREIIVMRRRGLTNKKTMTFKEACVAPQHNALDRILLGDGDHFIWGII